MLPIPAGQALDWLYEYGVEARQRRTGCLNLSTVHGAKGREFKHVLILDGGDWLHSHREEERRLYYVGMTRAMETLTLCEARERSNPLTSELEASEFLLRTAPGDIPSLKPELDKSYKFLGLTESIWATPGGRDRTIQYIGPSGNSRSEIRSATSKPMGFGNFGTAKTSWSGGCQGNANCRRGK